jgi:transcriptional regulator GlxA family with amidase domain
MCAGAGHKVKQIAIQFPPNIQQALEYSILWKGSVIQCAATRATQDFGLHLCRRERGPGVQAHAAEEPTAERA